MKEIPRNIPRNARRHYLRKSLLSVLHLHKTTTAIGRYLITPQINYCPKIFEISIIFYRKILKFRKINFANIIMFSRFSFLLDYSVHKCNNKSV